MVAAARADVAQRIQSAAALRLIDDDSRSSVDRFFSSKQPGVVADVLIIFIVDISLTL